MGPETSMEVQAALGSDLALVFDECTPFHAAATTPRARPSARTAGCDRCLAWHAEHGPDGQFVYGIVQGGVDEDLRRESAQAVAARDVDGIAIGGSLGEDKAQMYEVVDWTTEELPRPTGRATCSASARSTTSCAASSSASTPSTARCRRGSAATAWRSCPTRERRWRVDLAKARWKDSDEPLMEGCPCPACAAGSRAPTCTTCCARELTGMRLLTLHNLAFLAAPDGRLREAIDAGRLAEDAAAVRAGAAPWELAAARA